MGFRYLILVASFTDAWIETHKEPCQPEYPKSHLLQMRGLKLDYLKEKKRLKSRIFYRCVD